MYVGNV